MSQKLLQDLFQAYYDCRKNKRNTKQALLFELHLETNIFQLYEDIKERKYEISQSTIFIIEKPVKREICAADFRDRIVHHYIANKLNPYFEKLFIYDSYACRKEKWTLFWIKRAWKFLRTVSKGYSQEVYILKLDIAGFFMHIDHTILWRKLENFIEIYFEQQKEIQDILLYLCQKIVFHRSQESALKKSPKDTWIWLPKNKSLFFAEEWKWLPLWNLTSQIFANLYLHEFDIFVKQELKVKYYGRFVDDFFLFHRDRNILLENITKIQGFLQVNLWLSIHPKKIYLQHFSKGFLFLWTYIKPYRSYIGTRTKTNFYGTLWNISQYMTEKDTLSMRQSINSYLWFLKYCDTHLLRKKMLESQNIFLKDEKFLKVKI